MSLITISKINRRMNSEQECLKIYVNLIENFIRVERKESNQFL